MEFWIISGVFVVGLTAHIRILDSVKILKKFSAIPAKKDQGLNAFSCARTNREAIINGRPPDFSLKLIKVMATINNLENGYNKIQINFTQDKTADGKIIKEGIMINIREDSVQKAYTLYQDLLQKIKGRTGKPKKVEKEKDEKVKDEVKKEPEGIEMPICKCGSPMILRNGKWGSFYSCSTYPLCRLTKPYPEKKVEEIPCDQDLIEVPF